MTMIAIYGLYLDPNSHKNNSEVLIS
jgi:hypothetical protein